jgi:hypothetical protein
MSREDNNMDFRAHLENAWHLTIKYIAPLIIMTLVMGGLNFITFGILSLVTMAGYMQSILLMIREGREPRIQDIFTQFNLFFPLLAFEILVFIALLIGFILFILPGFILSLLLSFGCLYMLPLMTDKGMGLVDAIKESFRMSIGKNTIDQIAVMVLYLGFFWVGTAVFIGWLFTLPFANVFLLLVYEEKSNRPAPGMEPSPGK